MKHLNYGVEIELTGISRENGAKTIAEYFGTSTRYEGGTYSTWSATDRNGRTWKCMSDSSIEIETKSGIRATSDMQCEVVTPILSYEDIEDLQEIVRQLRHKGAIANASCGIHVHVDGTEFTAKTLRNLVNIMTSKEDLLFKALEVSEMRASKWCKKNETDFVERVNRARPTSKDAIERMWYNGESHRYEHYNRSRYHALNLHSLWQGKGIEFRCFNGTTHAGKIKTYIQLCLAIANQALTQNGASARKTRTNNEKYTFRTWLLRMGMIGDEYKTAREFLLKNLDGDIAFKNGRPQRVAA
jgi:hypothetical protein